MVPWSQLRQPCLGWMSTDLTSEFTHFNLVIRLSKVQQLALRFFSHFEMSRCSCGPCEPWEMHSSRVKPCRTTRNLRFLQQLLQLHCIMSRQVPGRLTTFRCGVSFFWWLSGEVKHFVHLIRWNLKAVLCQLGQDLTTVPVQGIIARLLGI